MSQPPLTAENDNFTPAELDERRGSVRHVCALQGDCQPITALETGNHWPVQAADISLGGVRLLLSRRFEPGTLLAIEFVSADDSAYMPLARVCRVSLSETYWLHGCAWADALAQEELGTLVGARRKCA